MSYWFKLYGCQLFIEDCGWEAGIRTPIGGSRVRSLTVRRPPNRRDFQFTCRTFRCQPELNRATGNAKCGIQNAEWGIEKWQSIDELNSTSHFRLLFRFAFRLRACANCEMKAQCARLIYPAFQLRIEHIAAKETLPPNRIGVLGNLDD